MHETSCSACTQLLQLYRAGGESCVTVARTQLPTIGVRCICSAGLEAAVAVVARLRLYVTCDGLGGTVWGNNMTLPALVSHLVAHKSAASGRPDASGRVAVCVS